MTDTVDSSFRSITGVPESAEPASSTTPHPLPAAHRESPANKAPTAAPTSDSGPAPMRYQTLNGTRSLNVSRSPSAAGSPQSSRDTSPARQPKRTTAGSSGPLPKSGRLSRKSSTDVSPNRGPSLAGPSTTIPSAASIQRALSSANIPQLPPNSSSSQDPSRVPRPLKSTSASNSGDNTPHWPISPRLKSPPPAPDARSRSRRNSLRTQHKKPDAASPSASTPAIVVQSSSPGPSARLPIKDEAVVSDHEEQPPSMKTASRGTSGAAPKLETVQESSMPPTADFDNVDAQSLTSAASTKNSDEERNDVTSKVTEDLSSRTSKQVESGSDTGSRNDKGKMQELPSASAQRVPTLNAKPSFSSLSTIRSRPEPSSRNMTVETETVPSIAQATIGNQERSASGRVDGSLRLKPSNETIRPRKERKTTKRKAPSINSSSKADVFEQKVANAVDEADSSDSDATFIYESNPPEQQPHRSRHHSRTPSMTSVTSLVDPRLAIRDGQKNPGKKISMKFHPYNAAGDADADRGDGTIRVGSGRISGGSHHHHIGRHGQGRGGLNSIVMDSDSSMAQPSRVRGASLKHGSQPNSPRFHTFSVGNGNGNGNGNGTKKHEDFTTYDIDTENAADDERTPLISSRSPRAQTRRRRNSVPLRQLERRHHRNSGWCRRFAGCLVLSILLLVLIFSAVGLVFATTKPLLDVEVREIRNVIASQEAIILDLVVDAVNPNVIGVTIADMDVIMFAKSKHVGSDKWWREHGNGKNSDEEDWLPIKVAENEPTVASSGVDEGTDPIDGGEPRTMSLGRIYHFDSPLNFDGSFLKHRQVESIGEISLSNPGNKTEAGGTERWEEVLQYPFELIVRGTFKYQLPLSTRERKIPVTATYYYDPDAEKKKLKAFEQEEQERKRDLSSTTVTSKPLGRYVRRTASLLDWYTQ